MATATSEVASLAPAGAPARTGDEPTPGQPVARGRAARAVVLVPAVLMLVAGLVGLDRHSMWRDEAATLVATRRDLDALWSMLTQVETVHAAYYTFLHGWLQLVPGAGVVWARVPSVLAMSAAVALVGLLGARLASPAVGVLAGLLLVVNPTVSFYAQEARSTALVAALALLATWVLVRALDRPRWWFLYGAVCVVLVALNLLAVLVPAAHLLTLLWWRRSRRSLARWAFAAAPATVLVLVLLLLTGRQQVQLSWIPRPALDSFKELAHLLLGATLGVVAVAGLLAVLGALPTAPPTARRAVRVLLWPPRGRVQALALPLLVLPPAALLAVSLVQPVFVPRYVFPSVAAAALLGAVGLERLAHLVAARLSGRSGRWAGVGVAAVLVLLLGLGDLGAQRLERTPQSRPDDLAGAAAVVAAGAQPGDALLFLPDNRRLVAEVYPGAFARLHDVALATGPEQAGNLTGRPFPVPRVLADLGSSTRVWAVGRPGLRLLPSETGSRAELDLLERDFVATQTPQAHGVGITLFVRRTAG